MQKSAGMINLHNIAYKSIDDMYMHDINQFKFQRIKLTYLNLYKTLHVQKRESKVEFWSDREFLYRMYHLYLHSNSSPKIRVQCNLTLQI